MMPLCVAIGCGGTAHCTLQRPLNGRTTTCRSVACSRSRAILGSHPHSDPHHKTSFAQAGIYYLAPGT
eukprot:350618-Chlamydomonas_euryale.AAC.6